MKELVEKLIVNAHFLILAYGLYGTYVMYDEHTIQLNTIVSSGSAIDAEIADAQKKVKEIQEFSKKSDEYKVRVEEVAKNIEAVQKQLPAETNDTQILTYLQAEINGLNIKDASFTPGKEDKSTYYISKEYAFSARGTYLQFLIFFERMGNADRIYNVKNLKLATRPDSSKGRFQIIDGSGVIEAFRFNPEFKVDRGF